MQGFILTFLYKVVFAQTPPLEAASSAKLAVKAAPGREELPLSMRLSLWSGWAGKSENSIK